MNDVSQMIKDCGNALKENHTQFTEAERVYFDWLIEEYDKTRKIGPVELGRLERIWRKIGHQARTTTNKMARTNRKAQRS